jgi:hypothetical protein
MSAPASATAVLTYDRITVVSGNAGPRCSRPKIELLRRAARATGEADMSAAQEVAVFWRGVGSCDIGDGR